MVPSILLFIALIPKVGKPVSFDDFKPISLCNCIYKMISKALAIRVKKILLGFISPKQFGFSEGKQYHEAIVCAQEL